METEDGVRLEAELWTDAAEEDVQRGVAVVCHPHPGFGGDMHNAVVRALSTAALNQGFSSLLFNFRGTGRSSGSQTGGMEEVEDVDAAMTYARQLTEGGPILLMGYSFGAKMATEWLNGGGEASAFVGVAVPSTTVYPEYQTTPSLYISGEFDDVAPLDDGLARSIMVEGLHVVIERSDHFFNTGREEIAEAVRGFIAITCPLDR